MKRISIPVAAIVFTVMCSTGNAACNCDDWVGRGGYCVDYVKDKIPSFPVPKSVAEITLLKNREPSKVEEGDVAIFDLGRYWHVAYVEKVHVDHLGNATAIDVSEMNYGGQLSFQDFKSKWKPKNASDWKRALCCGVTKKYDQLSHRKNIAIDTVEQVWSPDSSVVQKSDTILDKVREAFNQFIQLTGREL